MPKSPFIERCWRAKKAGERNKMLMNTSVVQHSAGIKHMVEQAVRTHTLKHIEETDTHRQVHGEYKVRTTFQRQAKGHITFGECDSDGKFVQVENAHATKEENLADWTIQRTVQGGATVVYKFPAETIVKAGAGTTVWARNQGQFRQLIHIQIHVIGTEAIPPHILINDDIDTWGTGDVVTTTLYDAEMGVCVSMH
jgi:hypothetical protein